MDTNRGDMAYPYVTDKNQIAAGMNRLRYSTNKRDGENGPWLSRYISQARPRTVGNDSASRMMHLP